MLAPSRSPGDRPGAWRRRTLLFLASIPAVACLPERDNPHDPSNRPLVRAKLIDFTKPNSTECGDPAGRDDVSDRDWPEVVAVGRGRCLAVDARATEEPQGGTLESLSFSFTLDTGNGPARVASTTGAILVLDASWRLGPPIDRELQIVVAATDDDGSTGTAAVSLVLLNGRPTAVADPTRQLPLGGWPWHPTGTVPVFFDGSRSHDPDGDDLDYCWTFPGETVEVCHEDADDPAFTKPVATAASGRFAARLVVTDGKTRSLPASSEVWIGPPSVWFAGNASGAVDASIGLYEPRPTGIGFGSAAWSVTTGNGPGLLFYDSSNLWLAPYPEAVLPGVPRTVSGTIEGAVSDGQGWIWALERVDGGGDAHFQLRKLRADAGADGGLAVDATIPLQSSDDHCAESVPPALSGRLDGGVWIASRSTGDLRTITLSGAAKIHATGTGAPTYDSECYPGEHDDRAYASVAVRPEANQAWAAPFSFSQVEDAEAQLEVYLDPDDVATPPTTLRLPFTPSDLAWISRDELLVASVAEGVVKFDIGLWDAGAPIEEAILWRAPELAGVDRLVVDPVRGAGWALNVDNDGIAPEVLGLVDTDGSVRAFDPSDWPDLPQFVDPDGFLWIPGGGGFLRVHASRTDGTVFHNATPIPGGIATVDASTGWLWSAVALGQYVDNQPRGLVATTPDGRTARVVRTLREEGGADVALPLFDALRVSGDGATLFLATLHDSPTERSLLRVDLRVDPPRVTGRLSDPSTGVEDRILDSILGSEGNPGTMLFAPAVPDGSFVWTFDRTSYEVFTVDSGFGASAAVLTLLDAAEQSGVDLAPGSPWAATMPASGRLCLVTWGSDNLYRVRLVETDGGGESAIATAPSAAGGFHGAYVATWGDSSGNEACWVATVRNSSFYEWDLLAVDGDGGLVGSEAFTDDTSIPPETGFPLSIVPVTGEEAWMTIGLYPGGAIVRRRLVFPFVALDVPAFDAGEVLRGPFSGNL